MNALRSLGKSPGFTAVAVLTFAVGIGATTAMFSALRALVMEPFSYRRALAAVTARSPHSHPPRE